MKFRDGMWLVAAGKHVEYAEEVYSITESEDKKKLSLLCPTRKIFSRGDTLNRPTITVDLEAVSDGIVSVEVIHWHGAQNKGPSFDLFPDSKPECKSSIGKSEKGTTLSSGSLSATVSGTEHDFDIRFHSADGTKSLTSLLNRSVAFAYDPATSSPMETSDMRNHKHYMITQSTLGVGEQVYGLGERFGALNKVGQSISLWNADGGTSSDQAYKNVSFWLSNRGYGIFIDAPERVELEIGSERCCRVQTSVEGQRLKWYIIYGPTPKEVLNRYTILTGKPGQVPAWSYGLWLSTSFTTDYDDGTVSSFLTKMRDSSIPVSVFHYDCFWLRAFHWCDFVFSPAHFPDPAKSIATLKSEGLCSHVSVWTNPYIGQTSPVFAHAAAKGYLLRRTNGDIYQWDLWQSGMGIIDFTNPAARDWYVECLTSLFDKGVDSIKTDFGERIPSDDVLWYDTTLDPKKMHNYYAFLYNQTVYTALQRRYGSSNAVVFARTACAGTQRFPLQWGGDCESTFEAMAESLRGGLSLGLCGYSFWSVDIGGFEGTPNAAVYKRWVQFGLLCSHSRLHGSNSYRVPWLVDNDATGPESCTGVLRTMAGLKCRLMPYLLSEARTATRLGLPLSVRHMALEFPEDRAAWACELQFMLGSRILVAPIFNEEGTVEFYLPKGRWTSWWDGSVVEGERWVKETHSFETLPVYVREGTVLLLGKEGEKRTVWDWKGESEVKMFEPDEQSSFEVVDAEGKELGTLTVKKEGDEWKVQGAEILE